MARVQLHDLALESAQRMELRQRIKNHPTWRGWCVCFNNHPFYRREDEVSEESARQPAVTERGQWLGSDLTWLILSISLLPLVAIWGHTAFRLSNRFHFTHLILGTHVGLQGGRWSEHRRLPWWVTKELTKITGSVRDVMQGPMKWMLGETQSLVSGFPHSSKTRS